MLTNCLKNGNWTVKDGVFIHSKSKNSDLYDRIWSKKSKDCTFVEGENNNSYWSEKVNRRLKLIEIFSPSAIHRHNNKTDENMIKIMNSMPLANLVVLDACSGHGFYSVAAIELGAIGVVSCDCSFKVLNQYSDKIANSISLDKKICQGVKNNLRIQADVNHLSEVFDHGYFDLSFIRMAIMHMKNPFATMRDLAAVTKPGGYIAFDCFLEGCTPEITRKLRDYFCKRDLDHVTNFLFQFGKVKNNKAERNLNPLRLESVFNNTSLISDDYSEDIKFLKNMTSNYAIEEIENKLHMEDFQSQYVHNLDPDQIATFCVRDLGLISADFALFRAWPGDPPDRGCFAFKVPDNWKIPNIDFPKPESGIEFK